MWKLIRKMFIDIIFVTILYLVSYTNRDSNGILQVQHLQQLFLDTRSLTNDFTNIITIDDYWKWLQSYFIFSIRAESWYNNEPVENMTNYINDKSNRLIGWAIMRQLRLKLNASCRIPTITRALINSCKDSYSIFNEEQRSFHPGWTISNNKTYSSCIQNAFIYRNSTEIDSYIYLGNYGIYGGGGYVYEFLGNTNDLLENITLLHELSWIDEESRAIMIQLNLYNPNVKLFTSVTLLIEISTTGQIFPTANIAPMQLYTEFNDFSSIFYFIISIIFILFLIYFTIFEIYSIIKTNKKKYFRRIHSYIEWSMIVSSWSSIGVYIWRYWEVNRIENYLHQTNSSQYINLQLATYIDEILTFTFGLCCFFGTIRLLNLFDSFTHVNMFAKVLRRAFHDIISFSFMFFLVFFSFVILFYLLFISKMLSCSSLLQTTGMLFQMLLLKFDFYEIKNADAFLGPFVFILFIYFVVFICLTMFITIIFEHLRYVRQQVRRNGDIHPNLITFIKQDIIKRIYFKIKLTKDDKQEQNNITMPSKYKSSVQQLPEKVNELFNRLDRICIDYRKFETKEEFYESQQKRRRKKHVIYSN